MGIKILVTAGFTPPSMFKDEVEWVKFLKKLVDEGLALGVNLAETNGKPMTYSDIARGMLVWFNTSATDFDSNPAAYPYCVMVDQVAKVLIGDADYMKWRKLGKLPTYLMHSLGFTPADKEWDVNQVLQLNPLDDHPLLQQQAARLTIRS